MKGCEGQLPTVQDEGMRLTKGDDGDGVQTRNRGRKDHRLNGSQLMAKVI